MLPRAHMWSLGLPQAYNNNAGITITSVESVLHKHDKGSLHIIPNMDAHKYLDNYFLLLPFPLTCVRFWFCWNTFRPL